MSSAMGLNNSNFPFSGRADLLRFLACHGKEGLHAMAEFAGYEFREKEKQPEPEEKPVELTSQVEVMTTTEHAFVSPVESRNFWYVAEHRVKKVEESTIQAPPWSLTTPENPSFRNDEIKTDYTAPLPPPIPLVVWSRLWPFLRSSLGTVRQSRNLDIVRLTETISNLRPLKKIHFKSRFGWDTTGCLIFDFDERLLPQWGDINRLHEGIEKLRGRSGLSAYRLDDGPEGIFRKRERKHHGQIDSNVAFRLPEPGTPVLIVSDLGYLEPTGTLKKQWHRFGRQMKRSGIKPVVLTPCPPVYWDGDLLSHFSPVWWDRGNRSFKVNPVNHVFTKSFDDVVKGRAMKAERLLALLSPAIRVEPELLRAMRMLLPCSEADTSTEILAWNHPSVERSYTAWTYDVEKVETFWGEFKKEPEQLRRKAITLIEKYHDHLSKAVRFEEQLYSVFLNGTTPDWAGTFIQTFFRTLDDPRFYNQENIRRWFHRFTRRMRPDVWPLITALSACWLKTNLEGWKNGTITPPEGVDVVEAAKILPQKDTPEIYDILQVGEHLVITGAGSKNKPSMFETGSFVATVSTRQFCITMEHAEAKTKPLQYGLKTSFPLPSSGPVFLSTDMDNIILDTVKKPAWASVMGRDNLGLYIKLDNADASARLDWPEWADLVGFDDYGLYAEFTVSTVTQRMRWIKPGTFIMGSPENEKGRRNNERQHQVTLTQGFWLGDTAVTKELWEAVSGGTPYRFKVKNLPMDLVNWYDCVQFIKAINDLKPALEFRMPTEAEWEYACRAGTKTPFSFGNNITTEMVNYNGNFPYEGGKKGRYRRATVPVKSLPANPWGLYEMHGNLWEWCSDWYEGFLSGADSIDPCGPNNGEFRIMRGGSWGDAGRFARSAIRDGFLPGDNDHSGFRLARN